MSRNVGLVVVVVAALAAVVWLVGGPVGLFGTDRGGEVGGPGENAPRAATAPEAGAPDAAGAGARPAGALEARRPERRGVGSLAARIVDVKDAALRGASVRVTGTGHGSEVVALSVASDAEGGVLLPAVPAGAGYVVRVEATGQPVVTIPDVEVRAGRRKDLGAIVVGARAALTGKVVDEHGAAVAGADVRAFTSHDNLLELLGNMMELFTSLGREPTPLARATTDADGQFRLADLPPGPVIVRATTARHRAGFANARMTADGPAGGPVTLRLEPGVLVSGVVVEATGAPVPGATVAIMKEGADVDADSTTDGGELDFFSRRLFAATDAKGAFSVRVPEGAKSMRAVVEAAGFPTTVSREFAAGDTEVRIVVARGAVLEVTTIDAATSKPVVGAQVAAMVAEGKSLDSKESGGGILYGVTDDRGVVALPTGPGRIEMFMVSHASYAASMTMPGQQEAMRAMGSPLGGDGIDVPKEVKEGETARATVRMKGGVRVVGRVTDAAGAPLPGVEVKSVGFMGPGGTAVRSDADGGYVLPGVSGIMGQPQAALSFRSPGFVSAMEMVEVSESVLRAGELRHDVTLKRAATLRGRVLDEAGHPVAGARVRHTGLTAGFDLEAMTGAAGVTTDAEGAWVLTEVPPSAGEEAAPRAATADGEDGAPEVAFAREMGKLRVAVTADGFVPGRSDPLKVREGEQVEVPAIRLSRGVTARGVVRFPDGRPAGGVVVEARLEPEGGPADMAEMMGNMMSAGRLSRAVRADAEGRYEVSGLAKGTLTVLSRAEGFAPSRRKAKVGTEPVTVDVTLRPASDLAGRVHGSDGRPLEAARVSVEGALAGVEGDEGFVEPATVRTDGDGRFTLKALPAGSLTVTVRADGHRKATMAAVPGGAPLDVRLEARAGRRPAAEVQQELMKVSQEFAAAKDDDVRKALQARLLELSEEMREDGELPALVVEGATEVPEDEAPEAPRPPPR